MSILKAINHKRFDISDLADIDEYVSNPIKTGGHRMGGYGCPPDSWVACNTALKSQYHAKYKKQFRHFVLGFDDNDCATIDTAMDVGQETCKFFTGYYAKFAVHTNTPHIHLHIIVGNTSYENGKQLDMPNIALVKLKSYCSDILVKHGCSRVRSYKWAAYDSKICSYEDEKLEIPESMYGIKAEEILYNTDVIQTSKYTDIEYKTAEWKGPPIGATRCREYFESSEDTHSRIIIPDATATSCQQYYVVEPDGINGTQEAFYHIFDTFEEAIDFCGTMPGRQGDIRVITNPFIKI